MKYERFVTHFSAKVHLHCPTLQYNGSYASYNCDD